MTEPEPTSSGSAGPRPAGGPVVRWWWLFVAPVVTVVVVAAGAIALVVSQGDSDEGVHAMAAVAPLELSSVSQDVAAHYRYAEAHQADFSAIPCFCGCQEFLDHGNLYDCFVRADGAGYDSHAAGCGVCIGEASVASRLLDVGTPAAEVAERIVGQFGTTPITSPDQTIPRP
jgi:hypothetical protein